MQTLEERRSYYAACHQNARNKATRFIGVPTIAFSLPIPLGWICADFGGVPFACAGRHPGGA